MSQLLSRDEFREAVFARDGKKCVICREAAVDAHHVMERRLFTDEAEFGGYFLDNGVSVCEKHHLDCESTKISPAQVREAAKIKSIILPSHMYEDQEYDKWGNIVLPNGQRIRGELFYDESVQKILKEVLNLFTKYVKYPRTFHVPHSPGIHKDDRAHKTLKQFEGKEVVITLKMDGEQFSMYDDYCHARSLVWENHPSRNWAKAFHARIGYNIPSGWRICAENLYACHSIPYDDLESFILCFSVWNDRNVCLSWEDTLEWFSLLEVKHVPVLYHGEYSEEVLDKIEKTLNFDKQEGYVMRLAESFSYGEFRKWVAKFVRPGHVQTSHNWKRAWKPNHMI